MLVLAICSAQLLAGRRINSEGLAFASKAILRQNTSDDAICQLCLPFPRNNSKVLGKGLNPFKDSSASLRENLFGHVFKYCECALLQSVDRKTKYLFSTVRSFV